MPIPELIRQAAGGDGAGVDQAVAVGEALEAAIGVVRGAGGIAARLRGLAQRIRRERYVQATGIRHRTDVAQRGVAVAEGEGGAIDGKALARGQAAFVVAVAAVGRGACP